MLYCIKTFFFFCIILFSDQIWMYSALGSVVLRYTLSSEHL